MDIHSCVFHNDENKMANQWLTSLLLTLGLDLLLPERVAFVLQLTGTKKVDYIAQLRVHSIFI